MESSTVSRFVCVFLSVGLTTISVGLKIGEEGLGKFMAVADTVA